MKKTLYILSLLVVIISCDNTKRESEKIEATVEKEELAVNLKSIEVEIEGMTCEIGCARTIQSKLSKFNGVSYANVDFESKKGTFTFDSNVVSAEEILTKIDGIAGGDLYSVTKTEILPTVINEAK